MEKDLLSILAYLKCEQTEDLKVSFLLREIKKLLDIKESYEKKIKYIEEKNQNLEWLINSGFYSQNVEVEVEEEEEEELEKKEQKNKNSIKI